MRRLDHSPAATALTLLRVLTGVIFVVASVGKFTVHFLFGFLPLPIVSAQWQVDLPARLATWLSAHPDGMIAAVVRDVLLPHGLVVAATVAWFQLIAGVLLTVGLFTRVASSLAVLVAGSLAVAAGVRGDLDARPYYLLLAILLALLIGRAGQWWGMDGWRAERQRSREF